MAEQVWTSGRLTAVYQPVGIDAFGRERFRRASFDLLEWAPVAGAPVAVYVNTLGFSNTDSASIDLNEAYMNGHEFGFYRLDSIVVEPHDGNGDDDTWVALHSFGYI